MMIYFKYTAQISKTYIYICNDRWQTYWTVGLWCGLTENGKYVVGVICTFVQTHTCMWIRTIHTIASIKVQDGIIQLTACNGNSQK